MSDDLVNVMNVLLLIENGLDEKLAQRVSAQWKAKCEELFTLRARVREVVGPFADQSECWPSIPDNQAMMTSNGEDLSAIDFPMSSLRAARQLMEEVK